MLLIISDSPGLASGLGRVTRELARRFVADGHQVVVGGWSHILVAGREGFPYPVVNLLKQEQSGQAKLVEQIQPSTVLAIGDPQDFIFLSSLRAQRGGFRLVGYLNIDAGPLPMNLEVVLDGFDVIATTSEFGANVLYEREVGSNRRRPYVIHHGVDRETFYPTTKPPRLGAFKTEDMFVTLVNAQNTERKNLPAAIEGFARFARGKQDVLLYMNTSPVPKPEEPAGWNLLQIGAQTGCISSLMFNPNGGNSWNTKTDDATLNEMYGAADALLVTSVSEGFGLPVLEAMATHTVPVCPKAYSMPELLEDGRGVLYDPGSTWKNALGADVIMVNPDTVGAALEKLYSQWKKKDLREYHRQGIAFAISRSWDRTYDLLVEAMVDVAPRNWAADGKPINEFMRIGSRQIARRHRRPLGILKLGGLGDMLQTTAVVRAAAKRWPEHEIVVYCNTSPEVFASMSEVSETIQIGSQPQDVVVRSIADSFDVFLDVRYVSRAYGGAVSSPYGDRLRWHYDHWTYSISRISDLGCHVTEAMLKSLGLEGDIRPVFSPREGEAPCDRPYIAVASGSGSLGKLKAWPSAQWSHLARVLVGEGYQLVQVGGKEDPDVPHSMDCRGESLARTATILEHANVLIAVEGGVVHLAAATGTKAIVLFGPTNVTALGYLWNVNLSLDQCTPCWWGPGWLEQKCVAGALSCLNLPEVDVLGHGDILQYVKMEMTECTAGQA